MTREEKAAAETAFAAELAAKHQRALEAAFLDGVQAGFRMGYRAGHSGGWVAALRDADQALKKVAAAKEREPSERQIATSLSVLTFGSRVIFTPAPGSATEVERR